MKNDTFNLTLGTYRKLILATNLQEGKKLQLFEQREGTN